MPNPPTTSRYNPSFLRYPIQNDRTGFKPVWLPVILIVPIRRTAEGLGLVNSEVWDVKFFISEAPEQAKVAGHTHTNLLIPPTDIYTYNVITPELRDVQINVSSMQFEDINGNLKLYSEAVEGDYFRYTLINGNVTSRIPYYPDADYHDLSKFTIDVEDLPRPERYYFIWQASYYRRIERDSSLIGEYDPYCITDDAAIAQYKILINHPGEIHNEMLMRTPSFYFEGTYTNNSQLQDNKILEFYRPFADLLQDIFDEQTLLNGINHISRIPAQLIPYLAYLIGWDLPNFPGVTDNVRRSILRHAVRLQKLKGTRRALVELFDIFGFSIDIINLWYSKDQNTLISHEDELSGDMADQKINLVEKCQIDPLIVDYDTDGFGVVEIPLVYKASGNITINAWLVSDDGATRTVLNQAVTDLTDDPEYFESDCKSYEEYKTNSIGDLIAGSSDIVSSSEVGINFDTGLATYTSSSAEVPLISRNGIFYDKEKNTLKFKFDHYIDFDETKIFVFATYPTNKLIIPDEIKQNRSNRFDVRLLLKNGEVPSTELFEFLLNFVVKLKAFHSLLRKIIYTYDVTEAYNVQDFCSLIQRFEGTGICDDTSVKQNLSDDDILLRNRIFNALEKEFETWKSLDSRKVGSTNGLNVPVNMPNGEECQYTEYGQDRVLYEPDNDLDHNEDTRATLCDTNLSTLPSNCFKGRVGQEVDLTPILDLREIVRCKPCPLSMGNGSYWLLPTTETSIDRDGFGSYTGQHGRSFLGSKIRQYNHPIPYSLHYSNRKYLNNGELNGDRFLGYERPSLEIEKDNLGFPGHRFITMNKIEEDFIHPTYKNRPWYDGSSASLETDTSGDQTLVYEEADLVYAGNGLTPDVSSLGAHENRDFIVTHKIYSTKAPLHPAITLDDSLTLTNESEMSFGSNDFDGMFSTYNNSCEKDYIDGYPAEYGRFEFDVCDYDFRGNDTTGCTDSVEALFKLGSQILLERSNYQWGNYKPYRLDCDCGRFGCGSGSGSEDLVEYNVSQCRLEPYQLEDGSYDFNCDKVNIDPKMILQEDVGVCSTRLDGTIPNLMTLIGEDNIGSDGTIIYKDAYGVIYESSWIYLNDILDIYLVTKLPYVWGEEDQGYVEGGRVYKYGIVTRSRQIIKVNEDGTYTIQGEGSTQTKEYFQFNVKCNEQNYVDNFKYHVDCMVVDNLEYPVICGSRFVGCHDYTVEWPYLEEDTSGVSGIVESDKQPFQWVNVWDNDDYLEHVCATDGTTPPVQMTYTGDGGNVPIMENINHTWPDHLPEFPFVSEIEVDLDRRVVELVNVKLNGFYHSFSGDLHAVLTSPDGISITLFHRPGSVNGNFGNFGDFYGDYTFVESGAPLLPDFADIVPGTYRRDPGDWDGVLIPIGSFDSFVSTNLKGTWTLKIYDWATGDTGSLDSWSMTLDVTCD